MFAASEVILAIICFILGAVTASLPGITIEIKEEEVWNEN